MRFTEHFGENYCIWELETKDPSMMMKARLNMLDLKVNFQEVTPRGGARWVAKPQPYFAESQRNFTIISGQTAYLKCRVHMLGDRQVTWMRVRDFHILTVGVITYSADQRFQVLHSTETDDWTLQVQYAQPRDSGSYKCQVNSDPKIARSVYLSVTDKSQLEALISMNFPSSENNGGYGTHITGGKERFLQAGSSLSLECVVTHTQTAPATVMWYHDDTVVDYDSPRGGISVQVEKTIDQTTSRLLLSSVETQDSGNYTCYPVLAPSASVSVHISNDELRAAVQHPEGVGAAAPSRGNVASVFTLMVVSFVFRCIEGT
ncbi:zwei Ig domain protein zig-8-like [Macrobrachium nipponense]|uniref:zwei Ig domain protein zig-8-like n=1 Tax=Macrobrachium nipponense TaxID=159736 RepID=UPI0030C7BEEC